MADDISTQNVKRNSLKIHVMPEDIHNEYVNNNLIAENELYLVETNTPLPLEDGGTGIKATTVDDIRNAIGASPVNHSSKDASYGIGTDTIYGHIKLSDSTNSVSGVDGGTAATPSAVKAAYDLASSKANTVNGAVLSENADFAEVAEWSDGNTNNEDRIGYFVTISKCTPGIIMKKAASNSDVFGVTMALPGFAANATSDKYDVDGNLLQQYNYVGFAGFIPVIDNGTCTVGEHCMPADDGTAVPSSNSVGYQVIERVDDTHILIMVEPQSDMLVRIKNDINTKQTKLLWLSKEDIDKMIAGEYTATGGSSDDDELILFAVRRG